MDEITVIPPTDKDIGSVSVKRAPAEKIGFDDTDPVKKSPSQRNNSSDAASNDIVIVSGADVSTYLIPLRDDFDEALTFRSILLATILGGFQAVMNQIYTYKPTQATMTTTFIVLISYLLGNIWTWIFPRGDQLENKWIAKGNSGNLPFWIKLWKFVNPREWSLKEHAICTITASSASNASASVTVFAAQTLFYDLKISTTTVILSVLSIGLFGYGLTGVIRPIGVWHPEAVYWTNLPVVKTLQSLHWDRVAVSEPLRYFWVAFGGMALWEIFPAYIFPWLNAISIPCLASQKATGEKAKILTNLFGGATNNEGLGMFSISLDYQYITSSAFTYPLTLQVTQAVGLFICMMAMIGIYYGNVWHSLSQPFMSTRLHLDNGTAYPLAKVFPGGVLNEGALEKYGLPKLSGSFVYALLMANAAIGALLTHCILFWGKDIVHAFKNSMKGQHDDPHHRHMAKHYKEAPWWWYVLMLVVSFVMGLVVVIKENITLPPWAYVVSLLLGIVLAPFSIILYSRFGNGIATNNLSKMLAGLTIPGRPIGNMYFAAWSHTVIANSLNLASDLKLGEYLKIPPRVMFLTQIYGTILGAFTNYGIMVVIVDKYRDLLVDKNGNAAWSGAIIQSYNTAATSWALAPWLFKAGEEYEMIPIAIAIGAGAVIIHWVFYRFKPKIGKFNTDDINLPQFIQYAGYIPYNQSQTCVILSSLIAGLWAQFYIRNYHPRFYKDYLYLLASAMDGGFFLVLFILSFSVFGIGSRIRPFPKWWGNNIDGYIDWCPVAE